MIHLGTQYYRPPFPTARYWEEDIKTMASSGLNTIQLWVVWAWVEAEPNLFRFDDYDRIVELAQAYGLEVVLSTIAAIQPYWIHRVVPDSEMIDNFGHKVVSSNRGECHYGLTPGGCIDHPGVWQRMEAFLTAVVTRYRAAPNLMGWDAWNELRWNVQADGLVCYCPHTLARYRAWLDTMYGGLDGLNSAWERRYTSWEDVLPGKSPNRPYTELMAFQDFIAWRSVRHAYARYDVIKALDPGRPVTVHGAQPTVLHGSDSYPLNTALHRGNDWDFADHIDGIGCSSFPLWGGIEMDRADFINRITYLSSAGNGKRLWLSELQGGRSNIGFTVAQSVDPASQQGWVWTGLSAGVDSILFWCWRDEVFGRESTGFGLAGNDGLAPERLAAMRMTGEVLKTHGEILEAYQPTPAQVGILFSPQSYYLYWAQEGNARLPLNAIQGYARALTRRQVPFRMVEEKHPDQLEGIKLLILPRVTVMDDRIANRLETFVREGGVIFCESETGAFGSNGIYRVPEDRYLAKLSGVYEEGRRRLDGDLDVTLNGVPYTLPATQWLTPMRSPEPGREAHASMVTARVGDGRVIFCGSYLGDAYFNTRSERFETFLVDLARSAAVQPPARVIAPKTASEAFVHVQMGKSGARTMAFVFAPTPDTPVEIALPPGSFNIPTVDLLSGTHVDIVTLEGEQRITLGPTAWGISVLVSG